MVRFCGPGGENRRQPLKSERREPRLLARKEYCSVSGFTSTTQPFVSNSPLTISGIRLAGTPSPTNSGGVRPLSTDASPRRKVIWAGLKGPPKTKAAVVAMMERANVRHWQGLWTGDGFVSIRDSGGGQKIELSKSRTGERELSGREVQMRATWLMDKPCSSQLRRRQCQLLCLAE